ncbi:Cytochrome P450 CYP72A219 like [Actinidia chinensis var. chinensis]|uniref:Cytochrome P450 CYP72A219 like n=1 Tax=Actinidia chinensis var. chinensis TaxID=1590841 RepID=A0A2R6PX69_ACTCC|nr:Cytochrome P450 CYP72A219 like [Actinidia chinensis var. chinensis]
MEQTDKESIQAASEEVSREFKTLINAPDLDSLKHLQHLISLKAKISATYPDAFPDDATIEALDQRPDLEIPQ